MVNYITVGPYSRSTFPEINKGYFDYRNIQKTMSICSPPFSVRSCWNPRSAYVYTCKRNAQQTQENEYSPPQFRLLYRGTNGGKKCPTISRRFSEKGGEVGP
jgi:hypothetical protein